MGTTHIITKVAGALFVVPVVLPETEPVVDPLTTPVVLPETEPVVDPLTTPVVLPETEPEVDPVVDPLTIPEVGAPKTVNVAFIRSWP